MWDRSVGNLPAVGPFFSGHFPPFQPRTFPSDKLGSRMISGLTVDNLTLIRGLLGLPHVTEHVKEVEVLLLVRFVLEVLKPLLVHDVPREVWDRVEALVVATLGGLVKASRLRAGNPERSGTQVANGHALVISRQLELTIHGAERSAKAARNENGQAKKGLSQHGYGKESKQGPETDPRTLKIGLSAKNGAGCTQNQPRRPILRPLRVVFRSGLGGGMFPDAPTSICAPPPHPRRA